MKDVAIPMPVHDPPFTRYSKPDVAAPFSLPGVNVMTALPFPGVARMLVGPQGRLPM